MDPSVAAKIDLYNKHFLFFKTGKTVVITINSATDPLSGGVNWNDGNEVENAMYLLHELGHAFNMLFGNGSSTIEKDVLPNGKIDAAAEKRNKDRLEPCRN